MEQLNLFPQNPTSAQVSSKLIDTWDALGSLIYYKNIKYGNAGLEPINVFSKDDAATGLLHRIDDKVARIKNSKELRKNDVADLIGYLTLLCVSKGWTSFEDLKD